MRDKATLRRIILASQHLMNRALLGEEDPGAILAGAEETLLRLGEARTEKGLSTPLEVIQNYQGGLNAFLDPSKRIKGISTGFTKLDEMTGGFHSGELIILAARPSMGKCLAANAKIVTGDGSIRTIGQICSEKKAELLTLQNNGRLSTTSPSAFVDDGIKPVFRVTTRLGRSVELDTAAPLSHVRWMEKTGGTEGRRCCGRAAEDSDIRRGGFVRRARKDPGISFGRWLFDRQHA